MNGTYLAVFSKDTRDTSLPTMKKQGFSLIHVTIVLLADAELHSHTTIKFANNSFSGGIHFLAWNPVTPHLFAVDCGCSVGL